MKRQQRFVAILAAVIILSGSFPSLAAEADALSEEETSTQESTAADNGETEDHEETSTRESTAADDDKTGDYEETSTRESAAADDGETADQEKASTRENTAADDEETADQEKTSTRESAVVDCDKTADVLQSTIEAAAEKEAPNKMDDDPLPKEAPEFDAEIVFEADGYNVKCTFTEYNIETGSIDTLYSMDGVNWETVICGDWHLYDIDDARKEMDKLTITHRLTRECEPIKSYLAGEIDRFFLKLRITKKDGRFYETQSAVIERGEVQPIPQGMTVSACFSNTILVRGRNPYRWYGKYQLTIGADATVEDVSALLPDTLPVEVHICGKYGKSNFDANCVIDCPVTWKPLSLPPLMAGESVTIPDAAEEILVPKDTVLNTPLGIFVLDQTVSLNMVVSSDEVELVFNISPENRDPTGGLDDGVDRNGLTIALHQKPTGASSIQAYVITEGESEWTELCGLSLLKELNTQLSTAGSGYALVLRNDQEPYRSYLEAQSAGETPVPFFVGLKFEGGIYDGKQLVLAWPDRYEQIPVLPKLEGAGGNEGNAGADNRDDSTESGQRPHLPQTSDEEQENKQQPSEDSELKQYPSEDSQLKQHPSEDSQLKQYPSEDSELKQQLSDGSGLKQQPSEDSGLKQPDRIQIPKAAAAAEIPENQGTSATMESVLEPAPVDQKPEVSESGQRPNLPRITQDTADSSPAYQESSDAAEWIEHAVQPDLVVQAATDIRDEDGAAMLSDVGAVVAHGREDNNRVPFLPATIAVSAVTCVSAAACKVTGVSLFHRIARIIRGVLRK